MTTFIHLAMQSLRLGLQDDTHSNFVTNLFVFPPQPLNVNFFTLRSMYVIVPLLSLIIRIVTSGRSLIHILKTHVWWVHLHK